MTSHTSVIGVKTESFFLIAGDGRVGSARYGRPLSYNTSKIFKIKKKVAVGFTGDLALLDILFDSLEEEYENPGQVKEVSVDEVKNFVYDLTLKFVETSNSLSSILVGGVGKGGFEMHVIDIVEKTVKRKTKWSTVTTKHIVVNMREIKENYVVIGSGDKHMKKFMKEEKDALENMSPDVALQLAASAIKKAIEKDWGTGARLESIIIKEDSTGFEHWVEQQEDPSYYLMYYEKPVRVA